MSTQTTNYGLVKPEAQDFVDIGVINGNMDKIDAELKKINNAAAAIEPADIGAAAANQMLSGINLLEWAAAQQVGGIFFTNNNVTGVPLSRFWHGVLTMGEVNGDKGLLIFSETEVYIITTMGASFANSKWRKLAEEPIAAVVATAEVV